MYYEVAGLSASGVASATFWSSRTRPLGLACSRQPRIRVRGGSDGGTERAPSAPESTASHRSPGSISPSGSATLSRVHTLQLLPNEAERQFNNDIQSVTHDAGNWDFTCTICPIIFGTMTGEWPKPCLFVLPA